MLGKILFHIIAGTLGIFLASKFVPGVEFAGENKTLLIIGTAIGIINFLVKPILYKITLPLRVLTLGLFSLIINMFLVWLVADVFFTKEIEIHGIYPLLYTTLIIWGLNVFFGLSIKKRKA